MDQAALTNINPLCPLCNMLGLGLKKGLLFCDGCELYMSKPDSFKTIFDSPHAQQTLKAPVSFYRKPQPLSEAFIFWFTFSLFSTLIVASLLV